ncbi:glycosyltransferase family 2 protein [Desulfosporosinus fructosivorans]|uniref:Glycosyltransferase family 2 protein n=1 Tax=Desulfosporosinus fructosivorans TaxID=2018669 RepID=A0A4Z0QWH2_9FIRM|nr:glycosyltransferase [Desulfosporosinus fructosivorans]TGE34858.1 glycosyltransferase family 2 protein [Desulfosporosinus fructosivorans]
MTQIACVSVLIPTLNEEKFIGNCLKSIVFQWPPEQLEIIVIDGESCDKTLDIVREFMEEYNFIKIINNPHKTVPYALNAGIRSSSGDIIIRLDAHAKYDPNYISECVKELTNGNAFNVGGPIVTQPGKKSYLGYAISYALACKFGVGNSKFRVAKVIGEVDTVPFGAFRRDVFEKIGFFNTNLTRNQDIEFNSRIRKNGGKIICSPNIQSTYYCRSDLKSLARQNYLTGMWSMYTTSIAAYSLSLRHYIPLIFVLSIVISFILIPFFEGAFFILVFILALYFSTSVFFSLNLGKRFGFKFSFVLPIVFLTLHLSRGIGSLIGLLTLKRFHRFKINEVPKSHAL